MQKFFVFVFVCFSLKLFSVESYNTSTFKQRNLIVEIGGNGLLYSVGFEETRFLQNELKISFRLGASFFPINNNNNFYSAFFEFNKDFGKNNQYFEIGIGNTFSYQYYFKYYLVGRIGYRYNADKYTFRISLNPFLLTPLFNNNFGFVPLVGISFGIPLSKKL